jgi:hypothetical protein
MRQYIIVILLLLSFMLKAQEQAPIATDRPDQTETPNITPSRWLQCELGFLHENIEGGSYQTFPSALWKYGINKNFELRLISELGRQDQTLGLQPITLGFKVHLFDEKAARPTTSLIVHMTTPNFGSKEFSTPKWAPSFRFLSQNNFKNGWSLGYNYGAEWNGDSRKPTWLYTLSAAKSLSSVMGFYVETYGYYQTSSKLDKRFDGGLTFLLNPNVQLDASGGLGVGSSELNTYLSLGLSWRVSLAK